MQLLLILFIIYSSSFSIRFQTNLTKAVTKPNSETMSKSFTFVHNGETYELHGSSERVMSKGANRLFTPEVRESLIHALLRLIKNRKLVEEDPSIPTNVMLDLIDCVVLKTTCGDSQRCPICLESLDKIQNVCGLNRCGHIFHTDCVTFWIHEKTACPVCKKENTLTSIITDRSNCISESKRKSEFIDNVTKRLKKN